MGVATIRSYCPDCKKITNHFYGKSVRGTIYVECEECGKE